MGKISIMRFDLSNPLPALPGQVCRQIPVASAETRVTWQFDSRMNYPMNLMLLFMNMEKMVGNDLATGLTNLKQVLEK